MKNLGLKFIIKVVDSATAPFKKISTEMRSMSNAAANAASNGNRTVGVFTRIGQAVSTAATAIAIKAKSLNNLGWDKATGKASWQRLPGYIKSGSIALGAFQNAGRQAKLALTQLADGIETVGRKMEALENIAQVGQTLSNVGNSIMEKFRGAVSAAAQEQSMMRDIQINGDLTDKQSKDFHQNARVIAQRQNVKTSDVLDVSGQWTAKSGDAKQAQEVSEPIVLAAKATKTSTADMGAAAYAMLKGLNIPASELAKTLDTMAYGAKQGGFEFKDMAQYLPNMIASAKSLGIEGTKGAASLTAAFQVAKGMGQDASTAANNVSNLLGAMGGPELAKRFNDVAHIDIRKKIIDGAKEGKDALQVVIAEMAKLTAADKNKFGDLFGDKESRNGIMALVDGAKEYQRIMNESQSDKAKGTVAKDAAARDKDLEASMAKLENAKTRISAAFGEALAPMLAPLADLALKAATWIEGFADSGAGKIFAVIAAGIGLVLSALGALSGGIVSVAGGWLTMLMIRAPMLSMFGAVADGILGAFSGIFAFVRGGISIFGGFGRALISIATRVIPMLITGLRVLGVAAMANPILAIVAVIAILVTLIIMNWSKLKPYFLKFWNGVKKLAGAAKDWVVGAWVKAVDNIKGAWSGVTGFFGGIWDAVSNFCKSAMDKILGWISAPLDALKRAWDWAKGIAGTPPPPTNGGGGAPGLYGNAAPTPRPITNNNTFNVNGAGSPQRTTQKISTLFENNSYADAVVLV